MNKSHSLELIGQWFDRLNEIESTGNPPTYLLEEMLDRLGPLITLLATDFERAGLDSAEVQIVAMKYNAHTKRAIVKRFEVVGSVSVLCGRLLHCIEEQDPADTAPADPWALHCETMEAAGDTHLDTAKTWKATHPDCIETIDQLRKRSENYRTERNRQRKAAGNPP